jgi:hypothetical protein
VTTLIVKCEKTNENVIYYDGGTVESKRTYTAIAERKPRLKNAIIIQQSFNLQKPGPVRFNFIKSACIFFSLKLSYVTRLQHLIIRDKKSPTCICNIDITKFLNAVLNAWQTGLERNCHERLTLLHTNILLMVISD